MPGGTWERTIEDMTTARATPARERLFTRSFVLLCLAELAYCTADGMGIYLVPLQAIGPLGAGSAGAGLAFGAFAVSALVLRPWAGRLCDTRGRRPLLIGGVLVALIALALTARVDSLAALVALRLLAGVGEAAVFVAIFAALADLAPADQLGRALSYNSLALYVGLAVGPLLADVLRQTSGFPAAWSVAALLAAIAAIGFVAVPETRVGPPAAGTPPPLVYRPAVPVVLGFLASIVAMGGFLAFVALHAQSVGLAMTSLPLVVYGGVVVGGRIAFAGVQDKLPSLTLGVAALGTMAAGLVVMAAWRAPSGLLAGSAVLALGVVFSTPAFGKAIFATARPEERGAASALISASLDLGLGFGPILLGVVAAGAGIPAAMLVGAGTALAGAGWTWWLRPERTGARSSPDPLLDLRSSRSGS